MNVMQVITEELKSIDIPYEFMRWTGDKVYPYFVGEYMETPTDTEDGYEETTVILTGTTRGAWAELENYKQKIKDHFPNPYGLRKSTTGGAVVIYYDNSFPVDTGEDDLKRIQINLKVKKWRGNQL
jgi:hypothetical protein